MYGDAQTVKSIVFPRRPMKTQTIEKYLQEIEKVGLMVRYSAPKGRYLWFPNFEKHQPGLNKMRESKSEIPPPTPELIQSNVGVTPPQVKDKVKVKDKEEVKDITPSLSNLSPSFQDVLEIYQQNFGEVNEDMEKELEIATTRFSASWVMDAIREAKSRGKNKWSYIAGILENWRRFGKKAKDNKNDPDKFVKGKYGQIVRR